LKADDVECSAKLTFSGKSSYYFMIVSLNKFTKVLSYTWRPEYTVQKHVNYCQIDATTESFGSGDVITPDHHLTDTTRKIQILVE